MMSESFIWILRFAEFSALLYIILIGAYTIGWITLTNKEKHSLHIQSDLSILVACRNEADNVSSLLESLHNQRNLNGNIEYLVVDDNSEDDTVHIVREWIHNHSSFNLRLLKAIGHGKKEAISQAINVAQGRYILVTDADCRPGSNWASTMMNGFESSSVKMVLGPVKLRASANFFEQMQALEFCSLIGSTAGAAAIGIPSMANGANMAFEKEAFLEVSRLRKDETFASGDDMFLLGAIAQRYGRKSIKFVASDGAIVETDAENNLKKFLYQRIRWASKSEGYKYIYTILPAWIVLFFNLLLFSLVTASLFITFFIPVTMLFFLLKILTDLPLLQRVSTFLGQRKTMNYFLPLSFLYPLYVVIVVFSGLFLNVSWKGRKVIKT